MAIDTETKRASVLNPGSHIPGRNVMQSEPDGSDLDDKNERGFVLWHYAGIEAASAVVARLLLINPPGIDGGFDGMSYHP